MGSTCADRQRLTHSARWKETTKHGADLQRAVRHNGPESPCIAGLRSICWKTFLLGSGSSPTSWHHALLESRSTYASLKDHFLKYIEHPEYLATASVDPLADDPEVRCFDVREKKKKKKEWPCC